MWSDHTVRANSNYSSVLDILARSIPAFRSEKQPCPLQPPSVRPAAHVPQSGRKRPRVEKELGNSCLPLSLELESFGPI